MREPLACRSASWKACRGLRVCPKSNQTSVATTACKAQMAGHPRSLEEAAVLVDPSLEVLELQRQMEELQEEKAMQKAEIENLAAKLDDQVPTVENDQEQSNLCRNGERRIVGTERQGLL